MNVFFGHLPSVHFSPHYLIKYINGTMLVELF